MSKYCGKSDFYDFIYMHSTPEEVLKGDIYIDGNLLKFERAEDLIPYYAHLTASISYMKGCPPCISLTRKSHVDAEEADYIGTTLRLFGKILRKLRKDEPISKEILRAELFGLDPSEVMIAHMINTDKTIRKEVKRLQWGDDPSSLIQRFFSRVHRVSSDNNRKMLLEDAAHSFGEFFNDISDNADLLTIKKYSQKLMDCRTARVQFANMMKVLNEVTDV